MSTTRLPELPEPPEHDEVITNNYGSGHTDEQLQQYARAYGLAVWKAAIQAAAAACVEQQDRSRLSSYKATTERYREIYHHADITAGWCASAIRSLPDPAALPLPEQGGPQ